VTREKKVFIDDLTGQGFESQRIETIDGIPQEHLQLSGHD
jgi:hypothetical protein